FHQMQSQQHLEQAGAPYGLSHQQMAWQGQQQQNLAPTSLQQQDRQGPLR
uniref:Mastermind n=1 Tax=Globodera pallida TaxID=36090 RepID=A0A183CSP1_GLOPA